MKQDLEYTVFIERYLMGEMSPEELNWFEKELDGNTNLRNEVELHKKVNSVLSDSEMIDLKNQLDTIHQEIKEAEENGQSKIRHSLKKAFYSTTALAVVVLMFTLYITNRNFSSDKLVEKYYEPELSSITFRGEAESEKALSEAMNFYNNRQYNEAIKIFENLLDDDNTKIGLNLYSGISHMEIDSYKIANERFQRIIDGKPNPFVESASWYLGLCYIMTDMPEEAKEQFEMLASTSKYYKKNAKKILRRLK